LRGGSEERRTVAAGTPDEWVEERVFFAAAYQDKLSFITRRNFVFIGPTRAPTK
jgi:hypothetical protein